MYNKKNSEPKSSTDEDLLKDIKDDLSDLTDDERSQMNDWYGSLSSKYDRVGVVIYPVSNVLQLKGVGVVIF
jgi:hypothetical protein